uniref:Uncharacterized protein n=1 Tax=Anguilla anguilla TaxID=7936 RepID=A0A0E9R8S2_ANGAN
MGSVIPQTESLMSLFSCFYRERHTQCQALFSPASTSQMGGKCQIPDTTELV